MKSKRRVRKARIKCANMNFVCDKCSHNILQSWMLGSSRNSGSSAAAWNRRTKHDCMYFRSVCGRSHLSISSSFLIDDVEKVHLQKRARSSCFPMENCALIDLVCFHFRFLYILISMPRKVLQQPVENWLACAVMCSTTEEHVPCRRTDDRTFETETDTERQREWSKSMENLFSVVLFEVINNPIENYNRLQWQSVAAIFVNIWMLVLLLIVSFNLQQWKWQPVRYICSCWRCTQNFGHLMLENIYILFRDRVCSMC